MRRIAEIALLIVFVGAGVLLALGKLPLPAPSVDVAALLPAGATEGLSSQCDSCSLECPLASGESESRPTIDGILPAVGDELRNTGAIPREYAWLHETPLSGGYLVGVREGGADAPGRLWAEILTASSLGDTVSWYRAHLTADGWRAVQTQDVVVPDGVFLSFQRQDATLNLLVEGDDRATKVFLDHPLRVR
jgi:hypothetical protein